MWDVAIAGGGPAGAASAIALVQAGLRTCLVDPASTDQKAGEGLAPSAWPLVEALGLDPCALRQDHLTCTGIDRLWGAEGVGRLDYLSNPYGSGLHLDRQHFDATLRAAATTAGAEHIVDRVQRLARADHGWQLHLSEGKVLTARWLIDATGRPAAIARQLGAQLTPADRLIAHHLALPSTERFSHGAPMLVEAAQNGWWYTCPLPGHARVWAFLTDTDLPATHLARTAQGFQDLMAETEVISALYQQSGAAPLPPPLSFAATSRLCQPAAGPDWLAIGDAALARDPLSGAGLTEALAHALEAADLVANCHKGAVADLRSFNEYITAGWAAHEAERADVYAAETRWSWSPFWARRHP